MLRQIVPRLALSTIATLCFALVCWHVLKTHDVAELPFDVEYVPPLGYMLRTHGSTALPIPLAGGEVVDLMAMLPGDRAALFYPASMQAITQVTLVLHHIGKTLRHQIAVTRAPRSSLARFQGWVGGILAMSFLLTVALLTLWGGRDRTSWGLFAFSLGLLLNNALLAITYTPIANFWIQQAQQVLQILAAGPALYMMAESLSLSWQSRFSCRMTRAGVMSLTLMSIVTTVAPNASLIYWGIRLPSAMYMARDVLTTATATLPVFVLWIGHKRANYENRLRIRWAAGSTALLSVTTAALTFMSKAIHPYLYQIINTGVFGLAIFGYLYAIVFTRLVDVSIFIDRTLAFSATNGILLGMFSLLEQALDRLVIAEKLNTTLRGLGAFLIAIALRPLHRWSDKGLERLFFQRRRHIMVALRRFTNESVFFETQDALLFEVCKCLRLSCTAVAVYERNRSPYKLRVGYGCNWPLSVAIDDPVFVALRTKQQEVDITTMQSAVEMGVLGFPMRVGESLTGAVICTPLDGEKFDQGLRTALSELSRSLATSLYLLRYEEHARLVADIASGSVDPAEARARAKLLMAGSLAPAVEGAFEAKRTPSPSDL